MVRGPTHRSGGVPWRGDFTPAGTVCLRAAGHRLPPGGRAPFASGRPGYPGAAQDAAAARPRDNRDDEWEE
ncbi:hypothetical protein GCM10009566_06660 [Streptomyces murinus]